MKNLVVIAIAATILVFTQAVSIPRPVPEKVVSIGLPSKSDDGNYVFNIDPARLEELGLESPEEIFNYLDALLTEAEEQADAAEVEIDAAEAETDF